MPIIRAYAPADRADVADVCLRTGDMGADATGKYVSDDLLPDVYAMPYVDLEPESAFVVEVDGRVAGYVLGAADTRRFVQQWQDRYSSAFRITYLPYARRDEESDRMIWLGLHPEHMLIDEVDRFPAHLHIDLLPEAQGQGFGRRLIRVLLTSLRARGVPGVHLGVSPQNHGARAFYRRLGFEQLASSEDGSLLGISTSAPV